MAKKIIRIGLDFDGVVAYNPFRVIRYPVTFFKREVLGMKQLHFFVPQTPWERFFWIILHESSFFPAKGTSLLQHLSERDDIEFHLITARFSFLQPHLYRWLTQHKLKSVFTSITMNVHDQQPHEYKLQTIRKLKLDYYVEDNFDIVSFVQGKTPTTVYWIYNITDRFTRYEHKAPYLKAALESIANELGYSGT